MSIVTDQEYYNPSVKMSFLSSYNEGTAKWYQRIFNYSFKYECKYGIDLYDFNPSQIREVVQEMNPLTYNSSRSNISVISTYLSWAIDKGLRTSIVNPLDEVSTLWVEQFVAKGTKLYVSEREMRSIEDYCVNAQDAVIFRLLFEGVQGKACSEISNLKYDDVDHDNAILTLHNADGKTRKLQVSLRCIHLIDQAMRQREYIKGNGETLDNENILPYFALVSSEYVLRNSITTKHSSPNVDKYTIYRRIDSIKSLFSGQFDAKYLTSKNIVKSGMIKMGRDLLHDRGKLDKSEYMEIAHRFRVNGWWLIKEFLNEETIEQVYGGNK